VVEAVWDSVRSTSLLSRALICCCWVLVWTLSPPFPPERLASTNLGSRVSAKVVRPATAIYQSSVKWVLKFRHVLGRLKFFTLLLLFPADVWRALGTLEVSAKLWLS